MWLKLTCWPNLFSAFKAAAKAKRSKPDVALFELHIEQELLEMQDRLSRGQWQSAGYTSYLIHDPKTRWISAAPFADRVVHHAFMQITEPLFERQFLPHSFANRKGLGTHLAVTRAKELLQTHPFVLQCDLKQFFASVDHQILYALLANTIACPHTLGLAAEILRSGDGILHERYDMVHFAGDDLLSSLRPRGLPIGNLTSQAWANVLLHELDTFVVQQLRCDAYVRYVDDFLLFSNSKKQLWAHKAAIVEKLSQLRLSLHHASSTVYPVKNGIPFLGMRLFPGKTELKSRNARAFEARLKEMQRDVASGQLSLAEASSRIAGWVAHAKHADSWALRRHIFSKTIFTPLKGNPDEL